MLTGVYETLRSAGRPLDLAVADRPELGERVEELREAARSLAEDASATDTQRRMSSELLELLGSGVGSTEPAGIGMGPTG